MKNISLQDREIVILEKTEIGKYLLVFPRTTKFSSPWFFPKEY